MLESMRTTIKEKQAQTLLLGAPGYLAKGREKPQPQVCNKHTCLSTIKVSSALDRVVPEQKKLNLNHR